MKAANELISRKWSKGATYFSGFSPQKLLAPGTSSCKATSASRILALMDAKRSRWQQWTGMGLNAAGRLGRILSLLRSAVRAECGANRAAADFFWREAVDDLCKLDDREGSWQEVCDGLAEASNEEVSDPSGLRRAVVEELFIESLFAAINAGLSSPAHTMKVAPSLMVLIRHARTLATLVEIPPDALAEAVAPFYVAIIDACQATSAYGRAIHLLEDADFRAAASLEDQDRWIERDATAALDAPNGASAVKVLPGSISRLGQMMSCFPHNPSFWPWLYRLHLELALARFHAHSVSEALLEIEKALAYQPEDAGALAVKAALRSAMETLIDRAREVRAEVQRTPGATLSAAGQTLVDDANRGFGPAQDFVAAGSQAIAAWLPRAQAARAWLEAGLPMLENGFGRMSAGELEQVRAILTDPPKDLGELDQQVAGLPGELRAHAGLRSFLERSLAKSKRPTKARVADRRARQASILEIASSPQAGNEPPAGLWLLSRQGMSSKVFAVAAMVVLVWVVGSAGLARLSQQERAATYERLIAAVEADNDLEALAAAESFLAMAGASGDQRRAHVETLAKEARDRPNRRLRDQAFDSLEKAAREGQPEGVLDGAESFFGAVEGAVGETRHAEVLRKYSDALVTYAIGRGDDAELRKRLAAYERHTS